jgi:hypothetical protein
MRGAEEPTSSNLLAKPTSSSLSAHLEGEAPPAFQGVALAAFAGIAILFAVGSGWLYLDRIARPTRRAEQARTWDVARCTVRSSTTVEVGSESGARRPEIVYVYDVAGRQHHSSRYDAHGRPMSPRRAGMIARHYEPGRSYDCRVNPAAPHESVLSADLPRIPIAEKAGLLGMCAFASLVALGLLREAWRTATRASAIEAPAAPPRQIPVDVRLLRRTRLWIFIAVSVLLAGFDFLWFRGILSWGINVISVLFLLFSIPLAVATAAMAKKVVDAYRELSCPVPSVDLDQESADPGDTARFRWRLQGDLSRVERVTIRLEGQERVPSDDDSPMKVVHREPIVEHTTTASVLLEGRGQATIPLDVRATRDQARVEWVLIFACELRGGARFEETFPLDQVDHGTLLR